MNPVDLVTPEMVEYCKPFKIIVVCGFAKTGKYPIAKKLAESLGRHLIISDDFGIEDFETFKNISTLAYNRQTPVVIEGVLSFRLLRKGLQENTFHADLILKTECDENTIKYFYNQDGEASKINRVMGFNNGLKSIWDEYREILKNNPGVRRPIYKELNTSLWKN